MQRSQGVELPKPKVQAVQRKVEARLKTPPPSRNQQQFRAWGWTPPKSFIEARAQAPPNMSPMTSSWNFHNMSRTHAVTARRSRPFDYDQLEKDIADLKSKQHHFESTFVAYRIKKRYRAVQKEEAAGRSGPANLP